MNRVEDKLATHDVAGARAILLDCWRQTRSPHTAGLIDLLDLEEPDELSGRIRGALTPRVATTLEAARALATIDDPRVSRWAMASLERLPFTTPTAQPLIESWMNIVRDRRDVRLLGCAHAVREGIRTRINRLPVRQALTHRLDEVLADLRAIETSEPSHQEVAIEKRLEPLKQVEKSEDALLDDVFNNPDDDGPRLVYADWLMERANPRGELIMLQFKRRDEGLSEAEAERESSLLKKHGKSWLGALAPVLSFGKGYSGTTFERGFVSTADIILSVGKKLEPLWELREWSTVERLVGSWPRELLRRAPLHGLKSVDRMDNDSLKHLDKASRVLPIVALELYAPLEDWSIAKRVLPRLDQLTVWWQGTPTIAAIQEMSAIGLRRLEVWRAWSAPRGPGVDDEVNHLLRVLQQCKLPLAELALMGSWRGDRQRPNPIELRPTASGFA